jgi:hypothetical protein
VFLFEPALRCIPPFSSIQGMSMRVLAVLFALGGVGGAMDITRWTFHCFPFLGAPSRSMAS